MIVIDENHTVDAMRYVTTGTWRKPTVSDKDLTDAARAAQIKEHIAKAKHFEEKAHRCAVVGRRGRERYFLRRKDHFTAKAVALKLQGAL